MNNKVIPFLVGFALAFSTRFIVHSLYWIAIATAFVVGMKVGH